MELDLGTESAEMQALHTSLTTHRKQDLGSIGLAGGDGRSDLTDVVTSYGR